MAATALRVSIESFRRRAAGSPCELSDVATSRADLLASRCQRATRDARIPESPKPLRFDTTATTCVAPEVRSEMMQVLEGSQGLVNPSSAQHLPGQAASAIVEAARRVAAAGLRWLEREVVFTSGATESINLALSGVAYSHADFGRHILTTQIEHRATLGCCKSLIENVF